MTKPKSAVLEPETSTAVAVLEEDLPTTEYAPSQAMFITEASGIDARDISYSRLKLLQGISQEVMNPESNLKAGKWHITGDDEGRAEVLFIPLAYVLSRRYDVGPKDDLQLLCMSTDGVTGVKMAEGGPGGKCLVCPFSQWSTDPSTGKRQLPCQPTYTYVGYVPEFGGLVSMSLSRTASTAAKELNGMLKTRGFGRFGIRLTASQVKSSAQNYFVPTIRMAKTTQEQLDDAQLMMGN